MRIRTILVAALTVSVAISMAQGGGQGRGGFGQGRGGQGELQLAMRKDVQTDLAVTADQKTKLEELQAKQRQGRGQGGAGRAGGAGGAGAGGGGGVGAGGGGNRVGGQAMTDEERAAMQKRMQEQRDQARKELGAILNEGQMKRLGEIQIQLQGNRAIVREETQKVLGLSTDQVAKIKDLQDKQQAANQALMEKVRNQELSREDVTKSRENNNKILDAELGKILTGDQASKLKDMGGKAFKADPPQAGGGR